MQQCTITQFSIVFMQNAEKTVKNRFLFLNFVWKRALKFNIIHPRLLHTNKIIIRKVRINFSLEES